MPKWYDLAGAEVGTKEVPGKGDNPKVVKYYADAGHAGIKHDSVAWCAAFANAMLERAGVKGSKSLAARSFLKWGIKLDVPIEGCIVVFKRGNSSWQGHVAFFVSQTSSHIKVLGGNQSDAVNARSYPKSKLLGYRWPEGYPLDEPSSPKPVTPGNTVKALQTKLNSLGHKLIVDGDFGKKTKKAVLMSFNAAL